MEKDINYYTETIFNYFIYFLNIFKKKQLQLGLTSIHNRIQKEVTTIVNNNNQYLLTDDYMKFMVWQSFYGHFHEKNYDIALLIRLGNLINPDESTKIRIYEEYLKRLLYSPKNLLNSREKVDDFINLMSDDTKKIFIELRDYYFSLINKDQHKKQSFQVLTTFLIRAAAYCILNNNISLFYTIIQRYYTDINFTIERLIYSGQIFRFSNVFDDIYDIIGEDLKSAKKGPITK